MYRPGVVTHGAKPAKPFPVKGVGKGVPPRGVAKGVPSLGKGGLKVMSSVGKGVPKITGGQNPKGNVTKPVLAGKKSLTPTAVKGLNAGASRVASVSAVAANPSAGAAKVSTLKVPFQKFQKEGPMNVPPVSAPTGAAKGPAAKASSQAQKGLNVGIGVLRPIALVKGAAKGAAATLKPTQSAKAASTAQKVPTKGPTTILKPKGLLKMSPTLPAKGPMKPKGQVKISAAPVVTGTMKGPAAPTEKKGISSVVSPWATKGNPAKASPPTTPGQTLGKKLLSFAPKGAAKGTFIRAAHGKAAPTVVMRPTFPLMSQARATTKPAMAQRMVIKHNLKTFPQASAANPPKAGTTPLLRAGLPGQKQKTAPSSLLKPGSATASAVAPRIGVVPAKRVVTVTGPAEASAAKRPQTTATTFSTADKPTSKSSSKIFPSTATANSGVQKEGPAATRVLTGFKKVPSHAVSTAPQKKI